MNQWIEWSKQIKAIAQIGLAYSKDKYDLERYIQLTEIAHKIIANLAEAPTGKVDNFFIPDNGYATPKVDLRAGIIKDNEILLAKEISDNKWTLPGGWADVSESPTEGIIREVSEETGYKVQVRKLIAIKDRNLHPYKPQYPFHVYKLFFLCDLIGGNAKKNIEISDIAFFKFGQLPQLSERRVLNYDIEMVFQYSKDDNLPVYCD